MRRRGSGWIARYTALYLIVALPLALCLPAFSTTFYWGTDATLQQYPTLRYVHDALRQLLSGGGFDMVNLSLGQGLDAIGTLAYYGLTDPLQWPAALFDGVGIEFYYHFLIFFYIYLSGLLFCVYARKISLVRGDDPWLVALAGLLFATCGYQTIGIIKNPYYAAGSVYLLLELIAVERLLRGRGWRMMSAVTALMVLANFYLAYQTSLLAALYCLLRLIARWRGRGARGSVADGLRLLGGYLLGLALSAVILVPVARAFLASGRSDAPGGYTASLLHYPWVYYLKLFALFCAPYDYAGYWSLQSFSPLALFGAALLFAPRRCGVDAPDRARGQLRAGFALMLVCLCVPLAGKVFNGFGYVTNRWCYGWAAVVCMAAARALPELTRPDFAGRGRLAALGLIMGALTLGYGLIASKLPQMNGAGNAAGTAMGLDSELLAALAGAAALFAASGFVYLLGRRLRTNPRGATRLLALAGAICCMAYTLGYGLAAGLSGEFNREGAEAEAAGKVEAAASELGGEGFYRVDAGMVNDNQADMLGYRGTSFYWSMIPAWVSDTYAALELSTLRWSFRLYGLDSDSYLGALASVRYALRGDGEDAAPLPLDFEFARELSGGVRAYEGEDAPSLGYAFYEVMSEEDWAALDPVRKREALASAAVLGAGGEGLPEFSGELPCARVEWEEASARGVKLRERSISGRAGGTLTLRFDAPADSEVYLRLSGAEVRKAADDTDLSIAVRSEAGTGGMYFIRRDGVFSYDQTGACHRLGWSADGMRECTLRFVGKGTIRFDEIELLCVPADYCRAAVRALHDRGWDAEVGANSVRGRMEMAREGILQISLPWSAGWTATVDGERAELLRCGGMYMGLRLGAGEHDIELHYVTPGLIPGAWVSLAALLLAVALSLFERSRRIRKKGDS